MGNYFNPTSVLSDIGRRLLTDEEEPTFPELTCQITPTEILIGHYYRNGQDFENAIHLYNRREFDEFERQANQGIVRRLGYYAVPKDDTHMDYPPKIAPKQELV